MMRSRCWLLLLGFCLVLPVHGADKPKATNNHFLTALRKQFQAWDLNKDGYLDKEELAKAFRGSDARPYDDKDKANATSSADSNDYDKKDLPAIGARTVAYLDVAFGRGPMLVASALAVTPTAKKTSSPTKTPDYSSYADYQFLKAVDKNNDEKISQDEYETWAEAYAVQLKQQDELTKHMAQIQKKLGGKLKAAERSQLQAQLQSDQAALGKLQSSSKSFERQIQKASGQ